MIGESMVIHMVRRLWMFVKKNFWICAKATKTEKIISRFYKFLLGLFAYMQKPIWLDVESVEQYCMEKQETMFEIEPKQKREVYEPAFFELYDGKKHQFVSPSVYISTMHNVMAVGATGLVLAKKEALCDAIKYDRECRVDFRYGPITKQENGRVQVKVRRRIRKAERAINLCGLAAFNYYHFTMEILSRLKYINHLPDVEKVPILIDKEIRAYPQLEELLHIMNHDREIIYVPDGTRIRVHFMIQPSMNTWMPINIKGERNFRMSDSLIAKSGVANIRSGVRPYMKCQTSRKIYISRKNCHAVRLVNEVELIPIFEKAGFDVVYTETMSYVEQVGLFSSVKCVVAPTGAALTNVIYCHPETVVGCIIPQEYNFCIYSTLVGYVGGKTMFLNPEMVSRGETIGEDCYQVDQEVCRRYVKKLVEMCEE